MDSRAKGRPRIASVSSCRLSGPGRYPSENALELSSDTSDGRAAAILTSACLAGLTKSELYPNTLASSNPKSWREILSSPPRCRTPVLPVPRNAKMPAAATRPLTGVRTSSTKKGCGNPASNASRFCWMNVRENGPGSPNISGMRQISAPG